MAFISRQLQEQATMKARKARHAAAGWGFGQWWDVGQDFSGHDDYFLMWLNGILWGFNGVLWDISWLPSGKLSHNYGKIHLFFNGKIHNFNGHFQ